MFLESLFHNWYSTNYGRIKSHSNYLPLPLCIIYCLYDVVIDMDDYGSCNRIDKFRE